LKAASNVQQQAVLGFSYQLLVPQSNKYAEQFVEKLKLAPLVDNVFDALEKYGQFALTAPSGPVQGVSNPSNG